MISRRKMLINSATLAALAPLKSIGGMGTGYSKRKFKIGACDWSIGKNSNIEAFDLAREIGLDGLMINMGSEENNLHLRRKEMQNAWMKASQRTGVKISSLAIGELNNVPYKLDPRTREWVWDSVDVASNLGVNVVLLAFFAKNDLRNDPKGIKEVISRLKEVAPHAERKGITLGIESYLNAEEHLDIIEQVGSPNVKVYMDFRNTADAGFDPLKEVRKIGASNICELHIKENGSLLEQGTIPWNDVRDLIYEINLFGDGWMQIEGSIPSNGEVVGSYKHNLQFLRTLFNKKL
jgi:sugar phosphate isomerase/epimerase